MLSGGGLAKGMVEGIYRGLVVARTTVIGCPDAVVMGVLELNELVVVRCAGLWLMLCTDLVRSS